MFVIAKQKCRRHAPLSSQGNAPHQKRKSTHRPPVLITRVKIVVWFASFRLAARPAVLRGPRPGDRAKGGNTYEGRGAAESRERVAPSPANSRPRGPLLPPHHCHCSLLLSCALATPTDANFTAAACCCCRCCNRSSAACRRPALPACHTRTSPPNPIKTGVSRRRLIVVGFLVLLQFTRGCLAGVHSGEARTGGANARGDAPHQNGSKKSLGQHHKLTGPCPLVVHTSPLPSRFWRRCHVHTDCILSLSLARFHNFNRLWTPEF